MERIYKYITLPLIILMAISCINGELTSDIPSAESGDEVKFGLSLQNPDTKTVYGDEYYEYTDSENKKQFALPIYWVDGDKVQIFSPQCLTGRRSAEYKVILPNDQDDKGNPIPPYYADDLVRTGEYGVQWGDSETADFYSLYPSGNYTLSESGVQANGITINYNQNIIVDGDNVKSDMEDCLMYAATKGVKKGDIVNLNYRPIATVVYVTISVAANSDPTPDEFTIQSITLKANKDQNIAGVFSLNIEDGTFGEFVQGQASNVVQAQIHSIQTGGYHILKNEQYVEIPLFLAPCKNLDVNGWKLTVVANNVEYTKTLTGFEKPLTPGQIHKVVLPQLAPAAQEWNPGSWMERIPRNVYLSEISIPGSWNSLNKDFQGTGIDIPAQYNEGVRAFHLDCRWGSTASLSGTGIVDKYYRASNVNSGNIYLSVCDAGGGHHVRSGSTALSSSLGQMMVPNNPSFQTRLEQVVKNVKSDEYMIVFCSFAHESFNDETKTGKTWMQAISDACEAINNSDDPILAGKIYNGSDIDDDTLVGDVLNSVIVIVNCEEPISQVTLPKNSRCLFVHIPNKLTSEYFPTTGFKIDDLYISSSTSSSTSSISMAVSQAQITSSTGSAFPNGDRGYYPSFSQRTTVVNAILDWSKTNYANENYTHDKWIYLGLGGSTASDEDSPGDADTAIDVLNTYSPLIEGRIDNMGQNNIPYYPIGIVFMNYTVAKSYNNESSSSEVVKKILLLNNKYRLQYDPSKPSDYTPNLLSASEYGSSATHGGTAISLD